MKDWLRPWRGLSPAWLGRLAWMVFALEVTAALAWATVVHLRAPQPTADGAVHGEARVRFGKSEDERRRMYQELVRGEPADRAAAERQSETAVWNRNHDCYFHQYEWNRLAAVCARLGIPQWQGYLILDEGMREHWPPPAGVNVLADDAPLARTTRPLAARRVIASGKAPPPPPIFSLPPPSGTRPR